VKPRVRFCWHCMRKLHGNHFTEYKHPEDGHIRIVHKACLEDIKKPINDQMVDYGTGQMIREDANE